MRKLTDYQRGEIKDKLVKTVEYLTYHHNACTVKDVVRVIKHDQTRHIWNLSVPMTEARTRYFLNELAAEMQVTRESFRGTNVLYWRRWRDHN